MSGERLSRRDFLRVGAALAGAGLLSACNSEPKPSPTPRIEAPTPKPTATEVLPAVAPQPDLLRLTTEKAQFTKEITKAAERIMASEVTQKGLRNKRTDLEEAMFKDLETRSASAADIILALQVAGTIEARGWGMQLL